MSDVRPGVTRRSFSGAGATLPWGTLSPGHEPRPHTRPHEQIVYIISGHGMFTVGDETVEVAQNRVPGRAGEHETPRMRFLIEFSPDRVGQLGDMLEFADENWRRAADHEARRSVAVLPAHRPNV